MKKNIFIFLLFFKSFHFYGTETKIISVYIKLKNSIPKLGSTALEDYTDDCKKTFEQACKTTLTDDKILFLIKAWNEEHPLTKKDRRFNSDRLKNSFPEFLDFETIKEMKECDKRPFWINDINFIVTVQQKKSKKDQPFQEKLNKKVKELVERGKIHHYWTKDDIEDLQKKEILDTTFKAFEPNDPEYDPQTERGYYLLTEKYQEPLRKHLKETSLRNKNN